MIEPALVAAEAHVAVKPPRAPKERAESEEGKEQQDRAARIEPSGRRYHSLLNLALRAETRSWLVVSLLSAKPLVARFIL